MTEFENTQDIDSNVHQKRSQKKKIWFTHDIYWYFKKVTTKQQLMNAAYEANQICQKAVIKVIRGNGVLRTRQVIYTTYPSLKKW